jgi:hypothetical protein
MAYCMRIFRRIPIFSKGFIDGKTTTNIGGKTLLVVDSSKAQGQGKLGALLQLYTKVIPDQQRNLHKVGAEVKNLGSHWFDCD